MTDPSVENIPVNTATKPVILVVDDSRVIRLALKKMLQKEFTMIEAGNGEEAWNQLTDDESIQMIFSGLFMPELDGLELLGRIRSSELDRVCKLPFIVMAGNQNDKKMMERILDCGATDMVTKPFQSREIKERAHRYAPHSTGSEVQSFMEPSLIDDIEDAVDNLSSIDQMLDAKRQESTDVELKSENSGIESQLQDDGNQVVVENLAGKLEKKFSSRIQKELEEQNTQKDIQNLMHSEVESNSVLGNVDKGTKEELCSKEGDDDGSENSDSFDPDLGQKIKDHARQQAAMRLVQQEGELEDFIAFDVNQKINSDYRDDRAGHEETEMIRAGLEKKFAVEREQQLASCTPFDRFIVSVLEQINTMHWINLDSKIKNILKRNFR